MTLAGVYVYGAKSIAEVCELSIADCADFPERASLKRRTKTN